MATEKGCLDQERKTCHLHKRTKVTVSFLPKQIINKNEIYTIIIDPKEKSYIDLTGMFHHTSSRGNTYLFLLYEYDMNAILFEPLKTR